MKKSLVFTLTGILLVTITAATLVACNKSSDKVTLNEEKEVTEATNEETNNSEITPTPTELTDIEDNNNDSSNNNKSEESNDSYNSDDSSNNSNSNDSSTNLDSNDAVAIFTDHLNTGEYIVEKTGEYKFQCNPSDNSAYWDIYVLDEPFEDALRYLTSAYSPKLKATRDSKNLKLNKGQYVYCVCSQNSFTDSGNSGFSCPLTIKVAN